MAPEDEPNGGRVVNDALMVHGVQNLRVANASILPYVLTMHPKAAIAAVVEKCADVISKRIKTLFFLAYPH